MQPSSAARIGDDTFIKLLMQENERQDVAAVRKGLADMIDMEEDVYDLKTIVVIDFFYDALQFCRRHCFNSLKTSECLKLMDYTRKELVAEGRVRALAPHDCV